MAEDDQQDEASLNVLAAAAGGGDPAPPPPADGNPGPPPPPALVGGDHVNELHAAQERVNADRAAAAAAEDAALDDASIDAHNVLAQVLSSFAWCACLVSLIRATQGDWDIITLVVLMSNPDNPVRFPDGLAAGLEFVSGDVTTESLTAVLTQVAAYQRAALRVPYHGIAEGFRTRLRYWQSRSTLPAVPADFAYRFSPNWWHDGLGFVDPGRMSAVMALRRIVRAVRPFLSIGNPSSDKEASFTEADITALYQNKMLLPFEVPISLRLGRQILCRLKTWSLDRTLGESSLSLNRLTVDKEGVAAERRAVAGGVTISIGDKASAAPLASLPQVHQQCRRLAYALHLLGPYTLPHSADSANFFPLSAFVQYMDFVTGAALGSTPAQLVFLSDHLMARASRRWRAVPDEGFGTAMSHVLAENHASLALPFHHQPGGETGNPPTGGGGDIRRLSIRNDDLQRQVANLKRKLESPASTRPQSSKGACYGFAKGSCRFGNQCKFSHDSTSSAPPSGGPHPPGGAPAAAAGSSPP